MLVQKLKYRDGSFWQMLHWQDTVWHHADEYWIAFEAPGTPFIGEDQVFLGTRYAILYFYTNEPFYFYELYEAEPPHRFEGWYCNINLPPERTPDGYSFVDLDLDVWLYPDLHYEVLDEDEFREHASRYHYPSELVLTAEQTLEQVIKRIAPLEFPFRARVEFFGETLEFLAARYSKPAAMPIAPAPIEEFSV